MAIPTPIISVVDAGGNGDFSTLATWESTQQRNLVTANEEEICMLTASGSLSSVRVNGWTTDHNHRITMRPYGEEAYHNGIATGETASINGANSAQHTLDLDAVSNVHVLGLHIASGTENCVRFRGSGLVVDGCILDGSAGVSNHGIRCGGAALWSNGPSFVVNTVIHGALTGVRVNGNNATNKIRMNVINCTIDARFTTALFTTGTASRIFSENNLLEATTIYSQNASSILIQGERDATSNTAAKDPALRNVTMSQVVVNPDSGLATQPYDYHLQTTVGPTKASGIAGSGMVPAGSGIIQDFEGDDRPLASGFRSIGADERYTNRAEAGGVLFSSN